MKHLGLLLEQYSGKKDDKIFGEFW